MTAARRAAVALAAAVLATASCAPNERAGVTVDSTAPVVSSSTTAAPVPTTTTPPPPPTTTTVAPTTTQAPATTVAPTSVASAPAAVAAGWEACVAALPLRRRIALLTWPGVYAAQWPTALATVGEHQVGGVALMTAGPDVRDRLAELRATVTHDLIVATDEEGGDVQRLRAFGRLPSAETMAATRSPDEVRAVVADHGRVIRALGVDMVLGPVVDVNPVGGRSPLGDRLFADDPAVVTAYARAYVDGWADAGLLAVLKHFPGHGSASADTHLAAGVTPPLDALRARDLVPYGALAPLAPAVMVGHLTVPGLTEDGLPTSLSPAAITGLLRDELGYTDALVLSDALEMRAVGRVATVPEAAVLTLVAGADVALYSGTTLTGAVIDAVEAAVADGRLAEGRVTESAVRVARRMPDPGRLCAPG